MRRRRLGTATSPPKVAASPFGDKDRPSFDRILTATVSVWRPSHGTPGRRRSGGRAVWPLPHPPPSPPRAVLVAEFENDVNPVTQDFLLDAIEQGRGGGVRRRRDRDGHARRPVLVDARDRQGDPRSREGAGRRLRRPAGASADSAGAVIGMAADVLAMAHRRTSARRRRSRSAARTSRDLRRKIVNDAAAYIGELARERRATSLSRARW